MHEARLLWGRKTPIQCVISLGTGLYRERVDKPQKKKDSNTSLKEKLTKIVASATDTEGLYVPHNVYKNAVSFPGPIPSFSMLHTLKVRLSL